MKLYMLISIRQDLVTMEFHAAKKNKRINFCTVTFVNISADMPVFESWIEFELSTDILSIFFTPQVKNHTWIC